MGDIKDIEISQTETCFKGVFLCTVFSDMYCVFLCTVFSDMYCVFLCTVYLDMYCVFLCTVFSDMSLSEVKEVDATKVKQLNFITYFRYFSHSWIIPKHSLV